MQLEGEVLQLRKDLAEKDAHAATAAATATGQVWRGVGVWDACNVHAQVGRPYQQQTKSWLVSL